MGIQAKDARVLVVAGEPSGERHAAGLVRQLATHLGPGAHFLGSGGREMAGAGVELVHDISNLAAIGPRAALSNLKSYWDLYGRLKELARENRPDLAILVDFPDFNLRLAGHLKALKIPVCYFISPQVWAWRQSRVKQIRRNVDLMLVIFPFEEGFYRDRGVEARYVGNPTATRFRSRQVSSPIRDRHERVLALLPGSRKSEVELILPMQLDAASYLSDRFDIRCWLIRADQIPEATVESIVSKWEQRRRRNLHLEYKSGSTETILPLADCAVVKSGTSTLEALLSGVPFAMVYRLAWTSWIALRPFVRTQTYCLANLVAGRKLVPEFIQHQATGERVGSFLEGILRDPARARQIRHELLEAAGRLGDRDAYAEAAGLIVRRLMN